jgi:hypothetical protein
MSGGSFNYLCDREAVELPNRTHELQDMVWGLRARNYEPEARETETILEQINLFQQTLEARAADLRKVWKAVEWESSGDWSEWDADAAVAEHRRKHPECSRVPGLPERDWETGQRYGAPREPVKMKANCQGQWSPAHQAPTAPEWERPATLDKNDSILDSPEDYAADYETAELEWVQWAIDRALYIQDEEKREKARKAAEDARWDARRAELIAQFNGGPIQVGNGQPIPTMALRAVEYIIEQERKQEEGK